MLAQRRTNFNFAWSGACNRLFAARFLGDKIIELVVIVADSCSGRLDLFGQLVSGDIVFALLCTLRYFTNYFKVRNRFFIVSLKFRYTEPLFNIAICYIIVCFSSIFNGQRIV